MVVGEFCRVVILFYPKIVYTHLVFVEKSIPFLNKTFSMSQSKIKSNMFFKDKEHSWEVADTGITRKIIGYDENIMMVRVQFETGAVGYEHQHHHSQTTYIESGVFEVTIAGEKQLLKAGDGFFVPPNTLHGAVCIEAGVLIDVFSPFREDF